MSEQGKSRIYVCHTYYHAYITCLKELHIQRDPEKKKSGAVLLLSSMSNDFGNLKERAEKTGLFTQVLPFDEKEDTFFPKLAKYRKDTGNIVINMLHRIRFTRKFGKLLEPYIPVNFKEYDDIYVFCDSDPIGYYLSTHKIYYHAVEDGLNCIQYYDTARYDNRGHFKLKAWMSEHNFIFIQNGYNKYCLDMEVNDISVLPYPCDKYIEKPRKELTDDLTDEEKDVVVNMFIENRKQLEGSLHEGMNHEHKVLILTEPLCDLETRKRIFQDIIDQYGTIDGEPAQILLKPHPRDVLDYKKDFSQYIILDKTFPMEILNYMKELKFDRVISVLTVTDAILFAREKLFLGESFMDKYEAPEIHRQNEQIY